MFKKRRRWLILLVVLVIVAGLVWRRSSGPSVAAGSYLLLALEGEYVEQEPSDLLSRLFGRAPRALIDVLEALRLAAVDTRIAGAIVEVRPLEIGWAKTEDLRAALLAFRASGKPVYAILETEVAAVNREYFLASAATKVYVSPASSAPLSGLAAQYLFLGGVWEKLDIEMHVEKIREYKTAGDMIINKEMSPYHREMANSLLDSINERFVGAIAEARQLTPEGVRTLIDEGIGTAKDYEAAGLSDGTKYATDVRTQDAGDAAVVEFDDYRKVTPQAVGLTPAHTLAVVYAVGPIIAGESADSSPQGSVMGSTTIAKALKEAADDEEAKAIIVRIDSPGGSALASDLVWQATREAQEKKPVIVSMSDVAASGGYYIAAGASRILAQPTTLTGSIGVVFAKPMIRRLLTRLGITTETLSRGKYATINDLTIALDEDARQKLVQEIEAIYAEFVDRVARGRKLSTERVNEIGRGRVWTGAQAVENGLADEAGGFAAAIRAAKLAAGIPETDEVELEYYPHHRTFAERLIEAMAARVAARQIQFPWSRELRAALALYPFTEPGVLALMPEVVVVR